MPYGERGFMRGRVTQEDIPNVKRDRKVELLNTAIADQGLSWVIKTRTGEDRWAVLLYDIQWREGMPGMIVMVDRDTDMDVKLYPAGVWFDMHCERRVEDDDWESFTPNDAYLRDLADRLVDEAERGNLS